jgi:hypothetical protein
VHWRRGAGADRGEVERLGGLLRIKGGSDRLRFIGEA